MENAEEREKLVKREVLCEVSLLVQDLIAQ